VVDLALPRELKALGQRAIGEARSRRAGAVEAEHLLLAILAQPRSPAAASLSRVGLDYAGLAGALDAERARSLAAAGIGPASTSPLAATPRTLDPGWGASIRDVLRGADRSSAKSGWPGALERELARTILGVELGTVSRALALAGVDRAKALDALGSPSG
jgi:ATP-dependent Clp protease ATP-binding subunit ClpA